MRPGYDMGPQPAPMGMQPGMPPAMGMAPPPAMGGGMVCPCCGYDLASGGMGAPQVMPFNRPGDPQMPLLGLPPEEMMGGGGGPMDNELLMALMGGGGMR